MKILVNSCWLALAALHIMPAAAFFSPDLVSRLYAVDPAGDVVLLLRHRGALFLAVVVACVWACVDANARRLASLIVALSMVSFLWLYVAAGRPAGALEFVARWDLIGLLPLLIVQFRATASRAAAPTSSTSK